MGRMPIFYRCDFNNQYDAIQLYYEVLIQISLGYPPVKGRLHTCYAPVRQSLGPKTYTPRLACVRPAASVHPEPGSNSSLYIV